MQKVTDIDGVFIKAKDPKNLTAVSKSTRASGFMVNFRVENLNELIASLKEEGISNSRETTEEEYGNFPGL